MYDSVQQLPDLPTEEELEEGIRAVQAAVAAAEHEEALQNTSSPPVQEPYTRSGVESSPYHHPDREGSCALWAGAGSISSRQA